MKITVITCFSTIRYVNINSGQYSTFDVKVIVFEKLSVYYILDPISNPSICSGKILSDYLYE